MRAGQLLHRIEWLPKNTTKYHDKYPGTPAYVYKEHHDCGVIVAALAYAEAVERAKQRTLALSSSVFWFGGSALELARICGIVQSL